MNKIFQLRSCAFAVLCAAVGMSAHVYAAPTVPEATATVAAPSNYLQTVRWDAEYDVVVVGYGFAGGAAAIAAADAGARVLLLEKAPEGHEGGNSRYAAQQASMVSSGTLREALLRCLRAPTRRKSLRLFRACFRRCGDGRQGHDRSANRHRRGRPTLRPSRRSAASRTAPHRLYVRAASGRISHRARSARRTAHCS